MDRVGFESRVLALRERADWSKGQLSEGGELLPAIVQHEITGAVLMLGYVSRESLTQTASCGDLVFYSRTRKALWRKGQSSGNSLRVSSIALDCDNDTFLVLVRPQGPVCHRETGTCFDDDAGKRRPDESSLAEHIFQLEAKIAQRSLGAEEKSYTFKLLSEGLDRILKKVGEESAEVLIAAKNREPSAFAEEVSDLVFHLIVLHQSLGFSLEDSLSVLKRRHGGVRRDGTSSSD